MSDDSTTPAEDEWTDWAEVAAADLADPTFGALVAEIDADQETWAANAPVPARHHALTTTSHNPW